MSRDQCTTPWCGLGGLECRRCDPRGISGDEAVQVLASTAGESSGDDLCPYGCGATAGPGQSFPCECRQWAEDHRDPGVCD